MSDPLLNSATKHSLDGFLANPSHALMLCGPHGMGKMHVAKYVTSRLLDRPFQDIDSYEHLSIVQPDKGSLTIEQVRDLQKLLKLRVPGSAKFRRVIIVEDAHTLTTEAQNALLKSLEEPPSDTVIILTSIDEKMLLPTIQSRVQSINILQLTTEQIQSLGTDTKLIAIADGRPGLMHALIEDPEHELVQQIGIAKKFLTEEPYQRIIMSSAMKERESVDVFLRALLIVSTVAMHGSATKAWQQRTMRIYDAQRQLKQNASVKLLLTDLSLSL